VKSLTWRHAIAPAQARRGGVGVARRISWRKLRITPAFLTGMRVTGADRSLLGDLEQGRPGRIPRRLLAGALIGLRWELFNIEARRKWIYTVPFFDELKLFEMPVLGFLGFPPFTVECFVLWQFLVTSRLAVDRDGAARPEAAGYDPFSLAAADPAAVAVATGGSAREAAEWVERARLATLRGIGSDNAALLREAGIGSVAELAAVEPPELADRLAAVGAPPRPEARLAVWVRAARQAMVDEP